MTMDGSGSKPRQRSNHRKPMGRNSPSLAISFARCFSTSEGRRVLRHLRGCTMERTLCPSATDAHLRHLEGQRQLVGHILMLVAQGAQRA